MPDPNQNNNQNSSGVNPPLPFGDTPPLPPDFQNAEQASAQPAPQVSQSSTPAITAPAADVSAPQQTNSGSAAPNDLPPLVTPPKKKFGGGRIIATILGLFLLVGGIGAGIVLTSQQQLFEQKASTGVTYCTPENAVNGYCTPPPNGGRGCLDTGCSSTQYCHCQGGQPCNYGVCVPKDYFETACRGDGREVCNNSENPQAKTCCAAGYVCGGSGGCVPGNRSNPPGSGTPRPTGTPPTITAACQNIKAYSTSWNVLTSSQLANLPVGGRVNFCVVGTATGGNFDRARFTVNGTSLGETTTQRPGSQDYCINYTIPASTSTFNVVGDIHHTSLGWK